MKLVLITAIAEFEKDVKKMLKEAKVKSYSYRDVKGFRDASDESVEDNWFGSEMNESEAFVYFVFATEETISPVRQAIEDFNKKSESLSAIHLAVMELTSIH